MSAEEALFQYILKDVGSSQAGLVRDEIERLKKSGKQISKQDIIRMKRDLMPKSRSMSSLPIAHNMSRFLARKDSVGSLPSTTVELLKSPIPKPIIGRKLPIDQWDIIESFNLHLKNEEARGNHLEAIRRKKQLKSELDHQLEESAEKRAQARRDADMDNLEMNLRLEEQQRRADADKTRQDAFMRRMMQDADRARSQAEAEELLRKREYVASQQRAREEAEKLRLQAKWDRKVQQEQFSRRNKEILSMVQEAQQRRIDQKEREHEQDRAQMAALVKQREEQDALAEEEIRKRKEKIERIANTQGKALFDRQQALEERESMLIAQEMERAKQRADQRARDEWAKLEQYKKDMRKSIHDLQTEQAAEKARQQAESKKWNEQQEKELLEGMAKDKSMLHLRENMRRLMDANLKKQMHEKRQWTYANRLTDKEKAYNQDQVRLMIATGYANMDAVRDLVTHGNLKSSGSLDSLLKSKPQLQYDLIR